MSNAIQQAYRLNDMRDTVRRTLGAGYAAKVAALKIVKQHGLLGFDAAIVMAAGVELCDPTDRAAGGA